MRAIAGTEHGPTEETGGVTTAWTLLALKSQGFDELDTVAALSVVNAVKEPKSTEWWTARLLLADRLGEERIESLRKELLGRQNGDGGWGWITSDNKRCHGNRHGDLCTQRYQRSR